MKTIGFKVEDHEYERYKNIADERGISMSELIKSLVLQASEQNDLKDYLRVGINKNLYMISKVLFGDDEVKVKEKYEEIKMQ